MSEDGRALLTSRERDVLRGDADVSDDYERRVRSLVRNRVRERFGDDVDVLEANFPEVHERLKAEVCGDDREESGLRARLREAIEARDDARARADRLEGELEEYREEVHTLRNEQMKAELLRELDVDVHSLRARVDELETAFECGDEEALEGIIDALREALGDA